MAKGLGCGSSSWLALVGAVHALQRHQPSAFPARRAIPASSLGRGACGAAVLGFWYRCTRVVVHGSSVWSRGARSCCSSKGSAATRPQHNADASPGRSRGRARRALGRPPGTPAAWPSAADQLRRVPLALPHQNGLHAGQVYHLWARRAGDAGRFSLLHPSVPATLSMRARDGLGRVASNKGALVVAPRRAGGLWYLCCEFQAATGTIGTCRRAGQATGIEREGGPAGEHWGCAGERTVDAVAARGPVSTMKSIPVFPYMSMSVPGSGTSV